MKRKPLYTLLIVCASLSLWQGRAEIEIEETRVSHPIWTAPMREDAPHPHKDTSNTHPRAPNTAREEIEFTRVVIRNQYLELVIAPELGMRILNAVDRVTGHSLSGTPDPRAYETDDFQQHKIWTAGYLEHSFPYFEHGMFIRQPGGYRIVRREDGAVQVAMNMRFHHWQHPRHMARHGNYSDRNLSVIVTLKPGERMYEVRSRVENPNPLPRGRRLWTNHHLHADAYDEQHILFPAGYVSTHSVWWAKPYWVKPFHAEGGEANYVNQSIFAIFSEHGFSGLYSPKRDFNSLILKDPKECPGLKLYSGKEGFFEIWVGSTTLFEHPGGSVAPYEPLEYRLQYMPLHDMGRVDWADQDVALAVEGKLFRIQTPRRASVRVFSLLGTLLAEGICGPEEQPLSGLAEFPLLVDVDGVRREIRYPLPYRDLSELKDRIDAKGGSLRHEMEEISNTRFETTVRDAAEAVEALLQEERISDLPAAWNLARSCFRLGRMDLLRALLDKLPAAAEQDYLQALLQLEAGAEQVDFASAGPDSYYLRAIQALREGKPREAQDWVERLLELRPTLYRPRLLQLWLSQDQAAVKQLLVEQPASIEALQLGIWMKFPGAAEAQQALLRNNPAAAEELKFFQAEVQQGMWRHIPRYAPSSQAVSNEVSP